FRRRGAPRERQKGQTLATELRAFSLIERFDTWSGRAKHHRTAMPLPQKQGEWLGMVSRNAFLLVCGLVLLVHHDQAKVLQRREKCGSRDEDHAHLPFPNSEPSLKPLYGCQIAVQQGNVASEP